MSLFDDSNDDSLIEIAVFDRIKSKTNFRRELNPNPTVDENFESLPEIREPPILVSDKSNETLTLDSDSDEEKKSISAKDVSNDSIEVLFCSPTLQNQEIEKDLIEDISIDGNTSLMLFNSNKDKPIDSNSSSITFDLNEDKPTVGNTSFNISFRSIGSTDWTPIKPNFINRTPLAKKTVRNQTHNSLKKSINFLNKKQTKEQKAIEREEKIRQKNERMAQMVTQKQNENANKEVIKSRGMKNANKYCFAIIDNNLYELIKQFLDKIFAENECNFRLTVNPLVPMSVTWIRKLLMLVEGQDSQTGGQSSQMSSQKSIADKEVQQNHILVVMDAKDFIERVNSYVTETGETLFDFAKQLIQKTKLKEITLLVLKLEQYFKRQKTKAQNQFRQRLNELESNPTQNRRQNRRDSMPSVTREDVDLAIIDMEFKLMSFDSESKISVIKANDYSEVSTYIFRFTRSVAEYLARNEKRNQNISWFAEADNRGTVDPIDEITHQKLWKRQLMQFPKISYEIANAIASEYPNPKSLLNGYNNSSKPELLLEDIVVSRRQPNGNSTERKVGRQLSTRIHLFMTSRNGEQLLDNS